MLHNPQFKLPKQNTILRFLNQENAFPKFQTLEKLGLVSSNLVEIPSPHLVLETKFWPHVERGECHSR